MRDRITINGQDGSFAAYRETEGVAGSRTDSSATPINKMRGILSSLVFRPI